MLHSRYLLKKNINSVFTTDELLTFKRMATLRNMRKLVAVPKEAQAHSRDSQSQETSVSGIIEYISQVSEEIESRVPKNLSQDFSMTESRSMGALSKLNEFLLNPQVRKISGTVSRTSRNNDLENREPIGDHFQIDPHPEVEFSACRTSNSIVSDPE